MRHLGRPHIRHLWPVALAALLTAPASAQRLVVLSTDTLTSTQRSLSGARSVVRSQHPNIQFYEFLIRNGDTRDKRVADSIAALRPDAVLTVGTGATQFAKDYLKKYPTIFSSVMYPQVSGFVDSYDTPGGSMTGASLRIPIPTQLRYFQMIVPKVKRLGVLYSEATAPLIPSAKVTALDSLGITIEAIKVSSERELAQALDSLLGKVDGLWSVADPQVFTPQATKHVLVSALRRNIPVMGFSRNLVESGALFALDFDYKAIGRQAGDLVNKVLAGAVTRNLAVTTPDIIWFHYNEKTAQYLKLPIPAELATIAKEVYR